MSTQGSAEGFQSSVHCGAGEVGEGVMFAYRQVGGLGT